MKQVRTPSFPAAPGATDALVGRTFSNRFRITGLIARGGMGKVYRAIQEPLGRPVALKVLNIAYTAESAQDFHRRFFLEAATAARLTHPHTVTIFDYGCSDDGIYYIAMEHLEGVSLRHALARQSVSARRALDIAVQICGALREAHGLGVVHRDLKPANVFLCDHGEGGDFVKVLDFGLVKRVVDADEALTQTGLFLGSPGYMAPEQIRGQPIDLRCDIYAIGAVLFEMLTGVAPFVRTNAMETLMAHVHDPVPTFAGVNPGLRLPESLEAVVRRCLEKEREGRFPDIHRLLGALRAELAALPADAGPTAAPRPLMRLDEMEASGWAVVSSTGALIGHRLPPVPPDLAEAPTLGLRDAPHALPSTVVGDLPPTLATDLPPTLALPGLGAEPRRDRRGMVRAGLAAAVVGLFSLNPRGGVGGAPRATPQVTHLRLSSEPGGAAVWLGREPLCDRTPCELDWARRGNSSLSLRFVLPGHDELVVSRPLRSATLTVHARLHATEPSESQKSCEGRKNLR